MAKKQPVKKKYVHNPWALAMSAEKYEKGKGGRPAFFDTPEKLKNRINEYFESCFKYDARAKKYEVVIKPTVGGLQLFLGFADRHSFTDYMNRNDEFSHIIKRARASIGEWYELNLLDRNTAVGAKFALSAMFGFKEVSEIIETKKEIDLNPLEGYGTKTED